MARNTGRAGPYSKPHVLARLDGRSREAVIMRTIRDELTAHVGGKPTVVQQIIINMAAVTWLRVALMARDMVKPGASERDDRHFLSWTRALTQHLNALGIKSAAQAPAALRDYIEDRRAP